MASVTPVSTYLAAILCRHIYPKGNHVVIQCSGVHPGLSGKNSSLAFHVSEYLFLSFSTT